MPYSTRLLMSGFVTHDTKRLVLSKPEGFGFTPGQGVEVAIDRPEWRGAKRPFTPTSLVDELVLEFTIKRYPERDGVTVALHDLEPGSPLSLGEAFGTIAYQGPGLFIAGGAGITPFIAILRQLAAEQALDGNSLIFANKTEDDLICGLELKHYLGDRCIFTFTRRHELGQEGHHVDGAFLSAHTGPLNRHFYVCGPPAFVASVNEHLLTLGVHPGRLVYEH
jgi:ferredoxin-NADP reductase